MNLPSATCMLMPNKGPCCRREGKQCLLQDPQAFIDDMSSIFDGLDLNDIAAHTSEIMQSMMEKIRNHQASHPRCSANPLEILSDMS